MKLFWVFAFTMTLFSGVSLAQEQELLNSSLTRNFVPSYAEFSSKDSFRSLAVDFDAVEKQKLIFHEGFQDNRFCWSYWTAGSDTLMRTCNGNLDERICKGKRDQFVNGYTNTQDGYRILFGFTPDEKLKYSKNVPVPLAKNYVITLNPLGIKPVAALPKDFYYEGFCEQQIKVHNWVKKKSLVLKARIKNAFGEWGVLIGNTDFGSPYYFLKFDRNNDYTLSMVFSNRKDEPQVLKTGYLPVSSSQIQDIRIEMDHLGEEKYELSFAINGKDVDEIPFSNASDLSSLNIGFRVEQNSIDGNSNIFVNDITLFQKHKHKIIPQEFPLLLSDKWEGVQYRGSKPQYKLKLTMAEQASGRVDGELEMEHVNNPEVKIYRRFVGRRYKDIVNFQDVEAHSSGLPGHVMRYSVFNQGNLEIINLDSLVMESYLIHNLHQVRTIDQRYKPSSNRIFLWRVNRKLKRQKRINPFAEGKITLQDLYFIPNSAQLMRTSNMRSSLDGLARDLSDYLKKRNNSIVLVHGHTDYGIEQGLSLTRAATVKSELRRRGVDAPIFCIGHGHSLRLSSIQGSETNRRVEVEVLKGLSMSDTTDSGILLPPFSEQFLLDTMPAEFELRVKLEAQGANQELLLKNSKGLLETWSLSKYLENSEEGELRITRNQLTRFYELSFFVDGSFVYSRSSESLAALGFRSGPKGMLIREFNIYGLSQR